MEGLVGLRLARYRNQTSAILFAESKWNKIYGYRHMPVLVKALDTAWRQRTGKGRRSRCGLIGARKTGHPLCASLHAAFKTYADEARHRSQE